MNIWNSGNAYLTYRLVINIFLKVLYKTVV